MLSLTDDATWRALHSTYSSGSSVALFLTRLEHEAIDGAQLGEEFQELCHQYTSTEAGYAAIPHLIRIAQMSAGSVRLRLVFLRLTSWRARPA